MANYNPNAMNMVHQQMPYQYSKNNYQYNGNGNTLPYNPYSNVPYNNYYMGQNQNVTSQQQNLQNQFLKCKPVSSREEARACQIDLDGSLWVFTDVGNGKIYTKQVNNDGTATFKTYVFTEDQTPYNNSTQFVTKEEFNRVIQGLMIAMQPQKTQEQMPAQTKTEKNSKTLVGF